jgi:UDPglucose 6-dehydrogenase
MGNDVICVDSDPSKIEMLRRGESPIYESGLASVIERNAREGRLSFTTEIKPAVESSQVIFIAVGTPPNEDGSADLRHVLRCATDIADLMNSYRVLVVKSTVPIGTCDKVEEVVRTALRARGADIEFDVVSNPEFLKEGSAVKDFMSPDRVVVGVKDSRPVEIMESLYDHFTRRSHRVLIVDRRSSEMIKYASNAMLALRISFMNELSGLCEAAGADVETVRSGIGLDSRIGTAFLYSGVGYGGSCFPKDVNALIKTSNESGCTAQILEAVVAVNERQKQWPLKVLDREWAGHFEGRRIAVWGVAFKPNTDDVREAPFLTIAHGFLDRDAEVVAHDPAAMPTVAGMFDGRKIKFVEHPYDAVKGADALVLLTEWGCYRSPDFEKIKSLMKGTLLLDGRNQYNPAVVRRSGLTYFGVGRGLKE